MEPDLRQESSKEESGDNQTDLPIPAHTLQEMRRKGGQSLAEAELELTDMVALIKAMFVRISFTTSATYKLTEEKVLMDNNVNNM